jgi:hypothetical protein
MPESPKVTVSVLDQRTITLRTGAPSNAVKGALNGVPTDYNLVKINALLSGHQRDQHVDGVELVFRRVP